MSELRHTAVYHCSTADFILRCLFFAMILQVFGLMLFQTPPPLSSIYGLLTYFFGVVSGVVLAKVVSEYFKTSQNLYVQVVGISEKKVILAAFIAFLPVLPDALYASWLATQHQNIRYVLLTQPDLRIFNPKVLMVFGFLFSVIATYYLVFLKDKSKKGLVFIFGLFCLNAMIYVSRTDFVLLLIVYLLNSKKIITVKKVTAVVLVIVALGLYTMFIQGRTEVQNISTLIDVVLYYSAYFGYPPYLAAKVGDVFGEISIAYSLFGYPVDVIETYFSPATGVIARHLEHIATPNWIGVDITGKEHVWANVLYPQYGFISYTLGLCGVFLYYAIISFLICVLSEVNKRWFYFWRVVGFLIIFESARGAAIGGPGTWFQIISALLITVFLVKKTISTRSFY